MDLWVFFKKPIHVMTTSPLRHFFVTKKKQNALKYGWMRWVWEEFSDLKIPKLLLELSADGFTPFGGCPHLHHSREPPVEGRKEVGAMEGRKEEGGQRGELGRSRGRKKREAHRMSVNNNTPPPPFFFLFSLAFILPWAFRLIRVLPRAGLQYKKKENICTRSYLRKHQLTPIGSLVPSLLYPPHKFLLTLPPLTYTHLL